MTSTLVHSTIIEIRCWVLWGAPFCSPKDGSHWSMHWLPWLLIVLLGMPVWLELYRAAKWTRYLYVTHYQEAKTPVEMLVEQLTVLELEELEASNKLADPVVAAAVRQLRVAAGVLTVCSLLLLPLPPAFVGLAVGFPLARSAHDPSKPPLVLLSTHMRANCERLKRLAVIALAVAAWSLVPLWEVQSTSVYTSERGADHAPEILTSQALLLLIFSMDAASVGAAFRADEWMRLVRGVQMAAGVQGLTACLVALASTLLLHKLGGDFAIIKRMHNYPSAKRARLGAAIGVAASAPFVVATYGCWVVVSAGAAVGMAVLTDLLALCATLLLTLMARDGWEGGGLIHVLTTKPPESKLERLLGSRFASEPRCLISGQPAAAAMGIFEFMQVDENTTRAAMSLGLDAIVAEVEAAGTDDDRECLNYILHEVAGKSERTFQNGWRRDDDPRRTGMTLDSFVRDTRSQEARLSEAHVVAERLYTTAAFRSLNNPLRDIVGSDPPRLRVPHPMPCTIAFIYEALKKMRAVTTTGEDAADALIGKPPLPREQNVEAAELGESPLAATEAVAMANGEASAPARKTRSGSDAKDGGPSKTRYLWRGMRGLRVSASFLEQGGTELAPMSTTNDMKIAVKYTRPEPGGFALLFMLKVESFMSLGADLAYLSAFPQEQEFLYPPLTYIKPTGQLHEYTHSNGAQYTIIEVTPIYPS